MLGVTERAGRTIAALLDHENAKTDQCLRLFGSSSGGRFSITEVRQGDEVFTFRDRKVLAVDSETAAKYASKLLDCEGDSFFFVETQA